MIRINLLPKEILERRKYERFYPWVGIAAAAILVAILMWYAVLALQVSAGNRELVQSQNTANELQSQAKAFFVFEEKEKELAERKAIVDVALRGRVPWGRLCNEISLVLPSEMWLTELSGGQITDASPYTESGTYVGFPATLTLIGDTPDTDPKSSSEGYKSLAKALVRLNDLPLLNNTWLANAVIAAYPQTFDSQTEKQVRIQQYTITSSIVPPDVSVESSAAATTGSNTAAPAPPSSAGQ